MKIYQHEIMVNTTPQFLMKHLPWNFVPSWSVEEQKEFLTSFFLQMPQEAIFVGRRVNKKLSGEDFLLRDGNKKHTLENPLWFYDLRLGEVTLQESEETISISKMNTSIYFVRKERELPSYEEKIWTLARIWSDTQFPIINVAWDFPIRTLMENK